MLFKNKFYQKKQNNNISEMIDIICLAKMIKYFLCGIKILGSKFHLILFLKVASNPHLQIFILL
jgi:hypothetical protein